MFGSCFRDGLRSAFASTFSLGLLFAAIPLGSAAAQEFRTIDGTDNNLVQPAWGSAETPLLRTTPAGYGDGDSTPAGATRPSAREISNALCAQPAVIMNAMFASDFVWQWGQFLDHDIDLTETHDSTVAPAEFMPITVPMGDPQFDPMMSGTQMIPMARSLFEPGSSPRAQLNAITAFIDASNV
ncbi:MAG: peroxidase family protein, partial [Planctomycetota bacterium]